MEQEYNPTPEQKIKDLEELVLSLRTRLATQSQDVQRFRRLHRLEVVVMAEDGARYLKGDELSEYLDNMPPAGLRPMTSAQFTKVATPVINQVFAEEYARYQAEHADCFAAQIDAEVMKNVKT